MPQVAEATIHKGKLKTAIKRYESGRYSLRTGADYLDVSAPTFAAILRRAGVRIRPAPHYGARKITKPCNCSPGSSRCSECESMRNVRCSHCSRSARWVVELPDGIELPACRRHVLLMAEYKNGSAKLRDEALSRGKKKRKPTTKKQRTATITKPLGSVEDQSDWTRCRSWQRMFIAMLTSGAHAQAEAAVRDYIEAAAKIDKRVAHKVTCSDCSRFTADQPDEDGEVNRFYLIAGVLYNALAAYDDPPDLCAILRRHFPQAPEGFSTVGW